MKLVLMLKAKRKPKTPKSVLGVMPVSKKKPTPKKKVKSQLRAEKHRNKKGQMVTKWVKVQLAKPDKKPKSSKSKGKVKSVKTVSKIPKKSSKKESPEAKAKRIALEAREDVLLPGDTPYEHKGPLNKEFLGKFNLDGLKDEIREVMPSGDKEYPYRVKDISPRLKGRDMHIDDYNEIQIKSWLKDMKKIK